MMPSRTGRRAWASTASRLGTIAAPAAAAPALRSCLLVIVPLPSAIARCPSLFLVRRYVARRYHRHCQRQHILTAGKGTIALTWALGKQWAMEKAPSRPHGKKGDQRLRARERRPRQGPPSQRANNGERTEAVEATDERRQGLHVGSRQQLPRHRAWRRGHLHDGEAAGRKPLVLVVGE